VKRWKAKARAEKANKRKIKVDTFRTQAAKVQKQENTSFHNNSFHWNLKNSFELSVKGCHSNDHVIQIDGTALKLASSARTQSTTVLTTPNYVRTTFCQQNGISNHLSRFRTFSKYTFVSCSLPNRRTPCSAYGSELRYATAQCPSGARAVSNLESTFVLPCVRRRLDLAPARTSGDCDKLYETEQP